MAWRIFQRFFFFLSGASRWSERHFKGGCCEAEDTFLLSLTGCTWLYDPSLASEIYWLIEFHFSLVILFILLQFVFSLYHFFALGWSCQVNCTVVPLLPALQGHLRGPAGWEALQRVFTLSSACISSSVQGGCKEEENLCLSICNRKLFYHPNVVKLLFNTNCESWTSQSSVPGNRADAGDKVIPGKLRHLLGHHHNSICPMFGRTDTWWQLGVGNEK